MTNYARLTPVYLSQMYGLKKKETRTWDLLNKSNFSVNKSDVTFIAIGLDHGIEQENCALKVLGVIKEIASSYQELD